MAEKTITTTQLKEKGNEYLHGAAKFSIEGRTAEALTAQSIGGMMHTVAAMLEIDPEV